MYVLDASRPTHRRRPEVDYFLFCSRWIAEQNGDKISEIGCIFFAQSRCTEQREIGVFPYFAAMEVGLVTFYQSSSCKMIFQQTIKMAVTAILHFEKVL